MISPPVRSAKMLVVRSSHDLNSAAKVGVAAVFQRDAVHALKFRPDHSLGADQRLAACLNWPAEPSEPPSAHAG